MISFSIGEKAEVLMGKDLGPTHLSSTTFCMLEHTLLFTGVLQKRLQAGKRHKLPLLVGLRRPLQTG